MGPWLYLEQGWIKNGLNEKKMLVFGIENALLNVFLFFIPQAGKKRRITPSKLRTVLMHKDLQPGFG